MMCAEHVEVGTPVLTSGAPRMELITQPTILFLDEPTTGMCLRSRYVMPAYARV